MPSKLVPGKPFSPRICDRLRALRVRRVDAKGSLVDCLKRRKKIEEDLRALGKKDTPERRELASEHWDTISEIESLRANISWYADEQEKTIDVADKPEQAELFPDDDDLGIQPPEHVHKPSKSSDDGDEEGGDEDEHPAAKNTLPIPFDTGDDIDGRSAKALEAVVGSLLPHSLVLTLPNCGPDVGRPFRAESLSQLEDAVATRIGGPHGLKYLYDPTAYAPNRQLVALVMTKTGKNSTGCKAELRTHPGEGEKAGEPAAEPEKPASKKPASKKPERKERAGK